MQPLANNSHHNIVDRNSSINTKIQLQTYLWIECSMNETEPPRAIEWVGSGVNRQRGKPTPGCNIVCIIQPRHRSAQEPPLTRLHSVAPWTWHRAVEQIVNRERKALVIYALISSYYFVVLKCKRNRNGLFGPFLLIFVSVSLMYFIVK